MFERHCRTVISAIAALAVLLATAGVALAQEGESIAVMKFETVNEPDSAVVEALNEALKNQIRTSGMTLSSQGGDVMLADVEFLLEDCDPSTNACLDRIAGELFKVDHLIHGIVSGKGESHLVWYTKGKGKHREIGPSITDAASAKAAAKKLIFGETGKLSVTTKNPGAEVVIDGDAVGLTPYEGELAVGRHEIMVRKSGFLDSSTRKVEVREGDITNVEFELEVDPDAVVDDGEMSTLMLTGWIVTGVGGATLIAASITSGLFLSSESSYEDKFPDVTGAGNEPDPGDVDDLFNEKDKAETLATTSNILWGIGGGVTATGLVLVLVAALDDDGAEAAGEETALKPTFKPELARDGAGASLIWTF